MRVLFITHYSNLYGANHSLLQLMKELKTNYKITPIVLLPKEGPLSEKLQEHNISFIISKFSLWQYRNSRIVGGIKYSFNLFLYIKIFFILKKYNIDIIHSNSSLMDIGAWMKLLLKKPHVWHIREFGYEDYNLRYVLGKKISSYIFRKGSDKIIAISQSIYDHYISFLNTDKISLVYNGIKQISLQEKTYLTNNKVEFCCLGVIAPNKNQFEIVKAFNILINHKNYKEIRLNLVGNGIKTYIAEINNYIETNHLKSHILLHGYIKDIPVLLQKMDVGIVPSLKEAFGRVSVEYMLNKMPVIASNTGANPEIVQDKITGLLYELGNIESLASKIEKLINHTDLISYYGESGYKRACQLFTSNINTEIIWNIYNNL